MLALVSIAAASAAPEAPAPPEFPPTRAAQIAARPALDAPAAAAVDAAVPDLVALYVDLHRKPELSGQEQATSARLAKELRRAGYEVTKEVAGTGVVGVLSRGAGPTVLIRTDMDALPVQEQSASPTPSEVPGVMHACGHDVHMASTLGAARALAAVEGWRGTVVVIGQPAEETGQGARAMIDAGLFTRFPAPDHALALHVSHRLPAGTVELTPGWSYANVDMVDVTFHGRGGHGARPHDTIDPIVAASTFVTSVQTVVSRRLSPTEAGVVTVGAFHAGSKGNVIPDEARLQLTVRSTDDASRATLLDGIRQIAAGTCAAFGCPSPPEVAVRDEFTPASYNHPGLTEAARGTFARVFGADHVRTGAPEMVGEDFGRYSRTLGVPALQFRLGTAPADAFGPDGAPKRVLPGLHAADYAPDPAPSIRTGALALTVLALSALGDGAKP